MLRYNQNMQKDSEIIVDSEQSQIDSAPSEEEREGLEKAWQETRARLKFITSVRAHGLNRHSR